MHPKCRPFSHESYFRLLLYGLPVPSQSRVQMYLFTCSVYMNVIRLPVPLEDDENSQVAAGSNQCFLAGVPTKASNCHRGTIVAYSSDSKTTLEVFPNGLARYTSICFIKWSLLTILTIHSKLNKPKLK